MIKRMVRDEQKVKNYMCGNYKQEAKEYVNKYGEQISGRDELLGCG